MAYDNPRAPEGTKLVLIAVALGLVAVILTVLWGNGLKNANKEIPVQFCTFTRTIEPGTALKDGDYSKVDLPPRYAQVFSQTLNCLKPEDVVGKVAAKEPLTIEGKTGQFIQNMHFTKGDATPQLPAPGKVWIPLRINSVNASGGLRIDAVVNITAPFNMPGERLPRTMTVMEHVRIKALGPYTEQDVSSGGKTVRIGGYRNFTIEVLPGEANLLLDIQRGAAGDFDLVICNPEDTTFKPGINKDVKDLLKLTPPSERPRPFGTGG